MLACERKAKIFARETQDRTLTRVPRVMRRILLVGLLGILACDVESTGELRRTTSRRPSTSKSAKAAGDAVSSSDDASGASAGTGPTKTGQPAGTTGSLPTTAPGTWLSGAAGDDVASGGFAEWRRSPVTIAGTWNDTNRAVQEEQWTVSGTYGGWSGALDVAIGAFWDGSWADAANGASDDSWRTAMQNIARARAGKTGDVFVRLAHEMNGDWSPWKVMPSDVDSFKKAWRRFVAIARAEMPSVKIVFGANSGTSGGNASVPEIYPGDDVVDVVGVDFYDMWPSFTDEATWTKQYMATEAGGSPRGIGAWLAFAKQHGKPLALPEWGLDWADDGSDGPQDNPLFIEKMNGLFRANAGSGPGQILYEIYYNIDDVKAQLHPVASNPDAASRYSALTWGK